VARPDNIRSIYLDSSALIAVIQDEPGCDPVKQVLSLVDQQLMTLYGSPLTLVEVRGQPRGEHDPERDRRVLDFLDGRVKPVELTRRVAIRARGYVGRYGLKPADAIHIASAVEAPVEVLWSQDKDFKSLWGSRVDGVWVDEPYPFGQQALPI
jgi:predicted nucleic acid-binding protein